ncbi:MAG: HD domain-containing protein [Campylobacterales bacterium]|nr:HD domain-containing protein [Campylobacterales bacterium]
MHDLLQDALEATSEKSLENIKTNFQAFEIQLETIQKEYKKQQKDMVDYIIQDIYENSFIDEKLHILFQNEKLIEEAFEKIIKLQKRSIKLSNEFMQLYPKESLIRKSLAHKIDGLNNYEILKLYLQIGYYSKETLYQYKDNSTLKKWLDSIKSLQIKFDDESLRQYEQIVHVLGKYAVESNEIEKEIKVIQNSIFQIIIQNQNLSIQIEKKVDMISNDFTKNTNSVMYFVLFATILFVIVFGYKINKNVGLSVDEIEQKVQEATQEIQNLNQEIESTQKEVVFTMGAIGESRSKETGNHVKRVAEYSKLFAKYYGLSDEEAELLKQASPMHDIGKVAIPDAILNKPGRFDEDEKVIMNTHAQLGYDMLKHSSRPILKAAAIVAKEHHEKWDGSGYPLGLKGEQIHIFGRITALADVFDALGSDRCYKKAWDDQKIFQLFKEEKGKHFDPKLVDIFFENLDQFLAIRKNLQDKF